MPWRWIVRRSLHCAGRHSAGSGGDDYSGGGHADDWDWGWSGVRWAGAGDPRSSQLDVCACGEVVVRRYGDAAGVISQSGARVSSGRKVAAISVG